MSKSETRASCVTFSFDNTAAYAAVFEPEVQAWLQSDLLEKYPDGQVYLATNLSNARSVIKQLLIPRYKAIFVIGSDASFERFINTYRELSPNPAACVPIGFVPLKMSQFSGDFGLSIPASRMNSLDEMSFSTTNMCLPELNSHLALRIHAGRRLSLLSYIPQSIGKRFMHTPLTKPLSGMTLATCLNESTYACELYGQNFLGHALAKDQIIFNKRILTLTVRPTRLEPPSADGSCRYFILDVESLSTSPRFLPTLSPTTDAYLCQRIKLEFSPSLQLDTPSSSLEASSVTITLSNRSIACLVPR